MRADFPFRRVFSLFERPVLLPSLSRNLTSIFSVKKASINKDELVDMSEDQAALMIQKAYRGHVVRKETAPLLGKGKMDQETMDMMKFYSSKWRSKSVFQVLLRYRAARYQDLVQFSQQVHLFNQAIVASLTTTNEQISIDRVDTNVSTSAYLGQLKPPQVHKLPFNFHQ